MKRYSSILPSLLFCVSIYGAADFKNVAKKSGSRYNPTSSKGNGSVVSLDELVKLYDKALASDSDEKQEWFRALLPLKQEAFELIYEFLPRWLLLI